MSYNGEPIVEKVIPLFEVLMETLLCIYITVQKITLRKLSTVEKNILYRLRRSRAEIIKL